MITNKQEHDKISSVVDQSIGDLIGEVTLQLVNVETGEVEHEQTERNILTGIGYNQLCQQWNGGQWAGTRLFISGRRNGKNPAFVTGSSSGYMESFAVATLTPSLFFNGVTKTLSTPYLAEFRAQYNPAASDRIIWAVGVCGQADTTSQTFPYTLVNLTTSCTQNGTSPGPGQVLFLTYRIQIQSPVVDSNSAPIGTIADRAIMERIVGSYTSDGAYSALTATGSNSNMSPHWNRNVARLTGLKYTANQYPSWNSTSSPIFPSTNGISTNLALSASNTAQYRYGGNRLVGSYTANQAIGCVMGSFILGSASATLGVNAGAGLSYASGLFSGPATSSTWQPVQNIFGHSVNGTEPFQQVTQLATGTGVMNATGTAWTNPNWPEFYRVEMTNTGNVGTARYSFAQRVISGLTSNSTGTNSNWSTSPAFSSVLPTQDGSQTTAQIIGQNASLTGTNFNSVIHGTTVQSFFRNSEVFNGTSVFTWDSTGVTLFDVKAETYTVWDTNSVPALPVTAVRQCNKDGNGNIWVACANTGLWKINVAGNTVTNYTTFNVVSTSNVYAVCAGQGDRIFVLVNGGLASTTNYGTSWTNESFTYTGISDSNWANVWWMFIQPNSPTFRMMLGRSTDSGLSGNVVWWSTASAAGIVGPTFAGGQWANLGLYNEWVFKNTRNFRVSNTGDYWTATTYNSGTGQKVRMNYGSSSTTVLASTLARNEDFMYDYYGTPYTPVYTGSNSGEATAGFNMVDRDNIILGRYGLVNAGNVCSLRPVLNFGNGMSLTQSPSTLTTTFSGFLGLWSMSPNWAVNLGSANTRWNLNQKDSPFEEMAWTKYQWNGSAWVAGYHAPALDTSGSAGGPYNGTRLRFDPENYTFTGRACVVVPTTALTGFFTNQLTFAARISPLAPTAGQGTQSGAAALSQLFSWVNLTNGNSLQVYFNNGSNNFVVRANGTNTTIGASPAYGGTYNVNVVINSTGPNTTAAVYVDGTQLGTTQTVITGGTLNFATANAEFVIGGNRVNMVDGLGFAKSTEFFRGTMLNVLLDSFAWTATEVSGYNTTPLTYTTVNTRVRYQLNSSLSGLETKTTHTGYEDILNGVQVKFTNGTGTSFVANESYTFGVCNGILKDNATSFTYSFNQYYMPVTLNFSDTDLATIPSAATTVTERICIRGFDTTSYSIPGYMLVGLPSSFSGTAYSFQSTTGDFTLTGTITNGVISTDTASTTFDFGVQDSQQTTATPKWSLRVKGNNTIDIIYNGSVVAASVTTWVVGDTVSIIRTGGVFTFFKNASLLFTTSGGQNSSALVWMAFRRSTTALYQMDVAPITLTYSRAANIVGIGNPGTFTGKYDPAFFNFDGSQASYFTVNIAGYSVPATVSIASLSSTVDALISTPPTVNNVIIVPDAGYMLFNSGDATKAVTVSCTMIKRGT